MSEHAARLKKYRMNQEEYDRACSLLKRELKSIEWALFSALWSEHCSYKSSKVHLKKIFSQSPRVLQSFGENAGVVDLGQDEKIAFKIESHNHPSFIEPYQGAATGVGGILRDIFTMGARPIALANYLCFGELAAPRMKSIVDGVVRGIGGYGNCVGVPTITGQTEFHESYNQNVLVNAMAVGYFGKTDPIFLSQAKGQWNAVVYVGAKTGRDGVHGASMASESFGDNTASNRPTVQIGDPFFEKLLIESCLEVMQAGLVVAIQDMGAAGLTSSSFEMAAKGGVGLELNLDQVPLRDPTMGPEEILLSESQERMLLICEPQKLQALQNIFTRWGLDAVQIGVVNDSKNVRLLWHKEVLTEIDPAILVDHAPMYERPFKAWTEKNRVAQEQDFKIGLPEASGFLLSLLKDVRGSSREWIYRQYDQHVGAATRMACDESVGVVRLPESGRALGVVLGCRPHLMRMDARLGGLDAIVYPALELAAKGFEALAVTDCLNFGNPEKENIMSEFVASLDGMNTVCRGLGLPIISGNVSFYNETKGVNITSTPSTGLVGLRDDIEKIPPSRFTQTGDAVYLLRIPGILTGGYLQERVKRKIGFCGQIKDEEILKFVGVTRKLSRHSAVRGSRVVGKFGLAYTLARMCLASSSVSTQASAVGAKVDDKSWKMVRRSATPESLFYEHLYEVIFVLDKELELKFIEAFNAELKDLKNLEMHRLGETIKDELIIENAIHISLAQIAGEYAKGFRQVTEGAIA